VISILNLKGGVGKTTLAANIAGYLSKHEGKRVLLIDLDHQRSLSHLLLSPKERELAADAGHTIQRFLKDPNKDGTALYDCSRPIPELPLCRVISNADYKQDSEGKVQPLDDLEMRLLSSWLAVPRVPDVRFLMRQALQSNTIQTHFDYVFIDCPPRLTTACVNALTGSDYLLMPTQAETVALESVFHLIRRLEPLRDRGVLSELKLMGFVASMVRPGAVDDDSYERELLRRAATTASMLWGRTVRCFDTLVRRYDQYAEATKRLQRGEPLCLAIHFSGVRNDIANLVNEIRSTIDAECGRPPAVPA
jgi:chromosome partitioning protein